MSNGILNSIDFTNLAICVEHIKDKQDKKNEKSQSLDNIQII